ncbi:MAG: hypothetical protein R3C10_02345 [Pirellulales bacterium]
MRLIGQSLALVLVFVLTLGCNESPGPGGASSTGASTSPSSGQAADIAEVEEDYKTWSLPGQVEFSAWASGDNHVNETTYIWGMLGDEKDYLDGDISFVVEQPDGTTVDAATMEKQKLEEPADPNYGATFVPNQRGRHRVAFVVTLDDKKQERRGGLIFDVD